MALSQVGSGGKRLRARTALRLAAIFGVPEPAAVTLASAVELLHNATLVHDDIQDQDRQRRGVPALWVQYGSAQAINAGDLLLMLPFLAVAELGASSARLSQELARASVETVRGQAEEMSLLERGLLDWDSYEGAARGKTGPLMALPAVGAALLADLADWQVQVLRSAFSDLGLVFQLQDDVADLFADKGRGRVGSDLYEGKVTALVAAHVERVPASREELLAVLRAPRESKGAAEVAAAQVMFTQSGALEWVLARLRRTVAGVRSQIATLDEPELLELTEGLLGLALRPIQALLVSGRGGRQ